MEDVSQQKRLMEFVQHHFPDAQQPLFTLQPGPIPLFPLPEPVDATQPTYSAQLHLLGHVFETSRCFDTEFDAKEDVARLGCLYLQAYWEMAQQTDAMEQGAALGSLFQQPKRKRDDLEQGEIDQEAEVETPAKHTPLLLPTAIQHPRPNRTYMMDLHFWSIKNKMGPIEYIFTQETALGGGFVCSARIQGQHFVSSRCRKKKESKEELAKMACDFFGILSEPQ